MKSFMQYEIDKVECFSHKIGKVCKKKLYLKNLGINERRIMKIHGNIGSIYIFGQTTKQLLRNFGF